MRQVAENARRNLGLIVTLGLLASAIYLLVALIVSLKNDVHVLLSSKELVILVGTIGISACAGFAVARQRRSIKTFISYVSVGIILYALLSALFGPG